jgi:hypothetical protein
MNAGILRNRVRAALAAWEAAGKGDYESIAAFISQVTQRDMALLKQQYRDDLDKARLTGLATGSDFYMTTLVPGNFIRSPGWTRFTFDSSDFNASSSSSYKYSRSSTRAGGGFLGIFGGRGSASNAKGESHARYQFDTSSFGMSFEIAQVPIVRPWFKTSFLASKLWRFDPTNPESKEALVCDGGEPPKGLIPAYPTALICIRNLALKFANSSGFREMHQTWQSASAEGGAVFSWGPFHLGGSHGRSSSSGERSSSYHYDEQTQTMTVPGAQIAGYKCHVFDDRMPDPNGSIAQWI